MSHVFISYVRENWPAVDRLEAQLRAAGFEVWLDRNNINPGHRWQDAIRDAIKSGDFFIACFSKEYCARPESYMNEELAIAIDQLRLMPGERAWFIPVVLDETDVPHRRISAVEDLSALQHVRLGGACWDDGVSRILKVLRANDAHTKLQSSRTSGSAVIPRGLQARIGMAVVLVRSELASARLPGLIARNAFARIRRSYLFLAACVVILASIGAVFLAGDLPSSGQSYVSHPGERHRFVLPDGSAVTLVGDSVLRTQIPGRPRVVILERGEALFNVKHDPKQLFQVLAGSGRIVDEGTEFDVRCYTRGIQVAVIEGAVEVMPRAVASRGVAIEETIRVLEGQQVTYGSDGHASAPHPSDPQILGWMGGLFSYKQTPLWEIIEDLQRDVPLPRPIALDRSLSELAYTGTIRREQVDEWIHKLPRIFPVEIIDSKPDSILIRRRN